MLRLIKPPKSGGVGKCELHFNVKTKGAQTGVLLVKSLGGVPFLSSPKAPRLRLL